MIAKGGDLMIQKAIRDELARGGQVFIIYNRIKDIELYTEKIKKLVPEAPDHLGPRQAERKSPRGPDECFLPRRL